MLSGANGYSGITSISAGTLTTGRAEILSDLVDLKIDAGATLRLGGNETVGGLNFANGSFIDLQGFNLTGGANNSSYTNGATITGTGSLVKKGTGNMYLNQSASTFSGGVNLDAGSVAFTSSGSAANGVITNSVFGTGTLTVNAGTTIRSSASDSSPSGRNIYNDMVLKGDMQFGSNGYTSQMTISTNASRSTTLTGDVAMTCLSKVTFEQAINGPAYRLTRVGADFITPTNYGLNGLYLRASNNIAGVTVA